MRKPKREIVLIAHNLRSCHNVGSLLRTADGLGLKKVILSGYTPYPATEDDSRLPYISAKIHSRIQKTALGAETAVNWEHAPEVLDVINRLKKAGFTLIALEQTPKSQDLSSYHPTPKLALIIGRETEGIEPEVLAVCDLALEIPMQGAKESFNVVQAAAMALYHLSQAPFS